MIRYTIQPASLEAHLFQITLRIERPDPAGQVVCMPAWIPGSYMIRDFAKHVVTLAAECAGAPVAVVKLDKQSWRCSPCDGDLEIRYQVYAWDLSVRTAHLDTTHGYFNGTAVFLQVAGREREGCEVEIQAPPDIRYCSWQVATTLPSAGAAPLGFGLYRAGDYAELVDHPVEMGTFTHLSFEVAGVPHEVAISGRHQADTERLCSDLEAICDYQVGIFGELPNMERYLFQVMAVGDGYGGLEHRSSTSLLCKRTHLPQAGKTKVENGYREFLGLCSHEYFHLWNGKRIQPQVLQDPDLSREVHTRQLWAVEGITSYYDDLSLVRSGRIDAESYLDLLARTITRVLRGSGRLRQTLEESSFDAWTKFYQADENAPNAVVSYYAKGALAALALDLTMRLGTDGGKSLDDLMRLLWERHGRTGVGLGDGEIERLAAEVSGLDLGGFFDRALRTTGDLPLAELLEQAGVGLLLRPARNREDQGGVRRSGDTALEATPVLGGRWRDDRGNARLEVVLEGGMAQQAGLAPGDLIAAVDGIRTTAGNLEQQIARIPVGCSVSVHLFRREELMRVELTGQAPPDDTCELWPLAPVSEHQLRHRRAWLQQEC